MQGLAELALDLPALTQLFVDADYNFYEWEDYLQEIGNLQLRIPRKANSKRSRGGSKKICVNAINQHLF